MFEAPFTFSVMLSLPLSRSVNLLHLNELEVIDQIQYMQHVDAWSVRVGPVYRMKTDNMVDMRKKCDYY